MRDQKGKKPAKSKKIFVNFLNGRDKKAPLDVEKKFGCPPADV